MVLVSGEATIFGLSIVDVSGGAAIRDDISLTARRTSLDKTFQTQRRRTHTHAHTHAHAHAHARARAFAKAPSPFNVENCRQGGPLAPSMLRALTSRPRLRNILPTLKRRAGRQLHHPWDMREWTPNSAALGGVPGQHWRGGWRQGV